ncbi:enoyl-CoA hydratase [Nocardioides albidus]|uniref:Enoyl-CoA hydratase n=1 Tax=Nocardioides albidus TaxID=1517589 RepID=A0A5C4WMP6_9ACTN|nr:enoyl-CoA hydratase [Nocardioides albidus]TNM49511.1 enoyl-CoA hydratase [Nocardioides albidus]
MSAEIVTELADGVLRLAINRPDKRNALTVDMYAQLGDGLERADTDPAVRAVLLHGHQRVFCAGNDLADFRNPPPVTPGEERPVHRFLRLISTVRKPLVAGVTGSAVGVGTTMLLHCDLVYAGPSARLQLPFVNLGLVPEAASTLLLPAVVGHQRAAELFLLGEPFDADRAVALGIVNAVVPDEQVVETALATARTLAAKAPAAVQLTKRLLRQGRAEAVARQMAAENEHFSAQLRSPEAAEALAAFAERRPPDFSAFHE